ncbi:MAG: gamma carbonic anhydrase family protein [Novosphingobium sp.]
MTIYALGDVAPTCAPTSWVAPSADVIGDVRLSGEVSVWFSAVIRGDNTPIEIGARTNIQDGAVLHSDPGSPLSIGKDCTIGHRAVLHGCEIGDRVLIGMGAIVLNGASIADDCIVGAGALVTEGKAFPSGSLIVGSPARAVREIDDSLRSALLNGASEYVVKSASMRRELRLLGDCA